MPIVNSKLGIEDANEIQLSKGGYYVYAWCCADWGNIFYYIGKGHGGRYKSVQNRGNSFMAIYNAWDVYPVILESGLTREDAEFKEDFYKTEFIFKEGYPIMDGEGSSQALKNRAIALAKEELRKNNPNWKDGRPRKDLADFQKFLKKQKDGELTVAECCEQLGISRATWYNRLKEVC